MSKSGERDYLRNIDEAGRRHAKGKPFTDPECGAFLMVVGAVMTLLPPPPARLLDLGCGTGWTSCFFAKRGYQVVGQDIAEDSIALARANQEEQRVGNLSFVVSDYEDMGFDSPFDCAVFFDSLHHAVDEKAALRSVFKALKPGGICVASEPGWGHSKSVSAREAIKKYNVTEKDMPPFRVRRIAQCIGFRRFEVYPFPAQLGRFIFQRSIKFGGRFKFLNPLCNLPLVRNLVSFYLVAFHKHLQGLMVMVK